MAFRRIETRHEKADVCFTGLLNFLASFLASPQLQSLKPTKWNTSAHLTVVVRDQLENPVRNHSRWKQAVICSLL